MLFVPMTVFIVINDSTNEFLGCFSKRSIAERSINVTLSRVPNEEMDARMKELVIKEVEVKESPDHL